MPNLKPLETVLEGNFVDNEPVDVAPQMAVENGFQKIGDFIFFALNLNFDSSIN
jgi:hypothetical protein